MSQIILVRHGETDWNANQIFRGRTDIELNETGIKQAQLLAEYLNGLKIEAIYSSPLKRALKTAEIIASRHQIEVKINPALIDFDYGEWQTLSRQEVEASYPKIYKEWITAPHTVNIPGGENLGAVTERATGVINGIIARHKGNVVLVSHRVVNKVLICALLGLDNSHFWNIKLDTCGVTTFTYENERFILTRHNDISHLTPLNKAPLSDF